jgi:hypothetical protein
MSEIEKHLEILPETVLRRNSEIIFTEIDGETVMMDAEFESYFGMAAVATQIWNYIEEEISFGDLCAKLMEKYKVEEAQCQVEVLKFLEQLHKKDLLLISDNKVKE